MHLAAFPWRFGLTGINIPSRQELGSEWVNLSPHTWEKNDTLCVMWSVLLHFPCTASSHLGFVQRSMSQLVLSNTRHDAVHSSHHLLSFSRDIGGRDGSQAPLFKPLLSRVANVRLKWSWFSMSPLSPCRVVALPSWKTSFKSIWKLSGQWASALLVCR